MRILFLSLWYPFPADNGSRIRIFNLIRQLARCHEVHLISFSPESVSPERMLAMAPFCASVSVVPYRIFQPGRLKALASFFSSRPRSAVDTYSLEFERRVADIGRRYRLDLVIASQIDMLLYPLRLLDVPRVLDELEVTTIYEQYARQTHPLKQWRNRLTWWKLTGFLAEILPAYAGCTVASDRERERVLRAVPGYHSVNVVPNGIDLSQYGADYRQPEADTLVYAGSLTYQPNFAAVSFFIREVFPVIRAARPNVKLLVTGTLAGVIRTELPATDGVEFTGYLADVRPRIAESWVSIVPLLAGGGTRVKILESMALGTPVVATTKGAEGLDFVGGRDILVADNPADFAAAVISILANVKLRQALSQNGRLALAAKYDWEDIGRTFRDLVDSAVAGRRGAP